MTDLNKYIEQFQDLDIKKRYIIFFVVLLILLFLDIFVLMRPQIVYLGKINKNIKMQMRKNAESRSNISKKADIKKQEEDFKLKVQQAQLQVIPKDEVPFLLEIISKIAEKSALNVDQIVPHPEDLKLLLDDKTKKYYTLAISVKATGGYHNFGKFLNGLENHERYFDIAEFSLKPALDSRILSLQLTLNIIVYEEVKK
ncbi:MAG: type 4a pilus biogenesis protein PilO [Candidatus Omnitrophica bacterium]|nr:type 4a pilus biogenesis protein PilO [Candidatus Omnitrophota bacterium]